MGRGRSKAGAEGASRGCSGSGVLLLLRIYRVFMNICPGAGVEGGTRKPAVASKCCC